MLPDLPPSQPPCPALPASPTRAHLQAAQALRDLGVVGDALKRAAPPRQAHDVEPAAAAGGRGQGSK